jgi:hypothetical protein
MKSFIDNKVSLFLRERFRESSLKDWTTYKSELILILLLRREGLIGKIDFKFYILTEKYTGNN